MRIFIVGLFLSAHKLPVTASHILVYPMEVEAKGIQQILHQVLPT
jgi:hypothetical protein